MTIPRRQEDGGSSGCAIGYCDTAGKASRALFDALGTTRPSVFGIVRLSVWVVAG